MMTRASILACAVGACVPAVVTSADEFFIADGDVAGLIAAINAANANGEADTIHLATGGLYTLTIPNHDGEFGPTGLPAIESEIEILGNGATIQRDGSADTAAFRFLFVHADGHLTLEETTLSKGDVRPGGDWGGAIFNRGLLIVTNCDISGCQAAVGGGIHNDETGTLLLTGSTLYGHAANIGGAVLNLGAMTAVNSTLSSSSARLGSGVYNSGAMIMSMCTISDNSMVAQFVNVVGGGIFTGLPGSAVSLFGCHLISNEAEFGGAVYCYAEGTVSLQDCLIEDNRAKEGGGIYIAPTATLDARRCTFVGNVAVGGGGSGGGGGLHNKGNAVLADDQFSGNSARWGGAIYNSSGGDLVVTTTQISCNTSGGLGGAGISNDMAIMCVSECTISYNSDTGASNVFGGGGIRTRGDGAATTITDSVIESNSATVGGGIQHISGSLEIEGTTVRHNVARTSGGGIENADVLSVADCLIEDNSAPGSGGGIHNTADGNLDVGETTLRGNSADLGGGLANLGAATVSTSEIHANEARYGGGAYNGAGGDLTLANNTVDGNLAHHAGGGIANDVDGMLAMFDTVVSGNTGSGGGGILNYASLSIVDCTIRDNATVDPGAGAGLYNDFGGMVTLRRATISGNVSHDRGGGIYSAWGALDAVNVTVSGNSAPAAEGGGLYCENLADASLINCTIATNYSGGRGGGIFNDPGSGVTLADTIVADNAWGGGGGGRGSDIAGPYTDAGHNLIGDGAGLTHPASLSGDPMLGPLANNGGPTFTHALLPGSPAINAGAFNFMLPPEDQRGIFRPQSGLADIGAYELEIAVVPDIDVTGNGIINTFDLLILLAGWGACPMQGTCRADLNGDALVNVTDLLILLANWTPAIQP